MAALRLDQIWAGEPQANGAARRLCDSSFNHLYGLNAERTVRGFMPVLSLCNQVDLWRYGRSAALAVF
jgi:hypothetical protein